MAEKTKGANPRKKGATPDLSTILGVIVALGGILGGMLIEGGKLEEVIQETGAIIVFGGTIGAVLVTTPMRVLKNAMRKLGLLFFESGESPNEAIDRIVALATRARKGGIVSLESDADHIDDPFLKKALNLAIDGTDIKEIRVMMELELDAEERHDDEVSRVWTAAGGYAPTIGIIGAVLGLMQVMKDLTQIDKVGKGIATAFVATLYGVASANILFLPAGAKIKARCQASRQVKEMMLEGVLGIVEGLNPKLIRTKLEAYSNHWGAPAKAAKDAPGAKNAPGANANAGKAAAAAGGD